MRFDPDDGCCCALKEMLGDNKNSVFFCVERKVLKYINEMYDQ